ncbi:hypothetical protein [Streptomyces sp. WMMB303]|uniref:hypothetical protein n=1 Tax=Streptomyces sp. WMMB303 TaxID=3034154 RepID=UPI0023ED4FB8|nr:hypothetical protein [Streptomyces sp. WMMB303]MDF4250299.1 hypothetical protein [Streptomyces sp. WMMB303]
MERSEPPGGHREENSPQEEARPCEDCAWFRTMINRAAGDPEPRADLEALFGAHLRRKHLPTVPGAGRRLRSV